MYICIEGNIGAGKSTVAVSLAKRMGGVFLPEQFEENPLLPLFYEHKKRMAFPLEYSFLISRQAQLNKHFSMVKNKNTIADFSLNKCLWFAKSNLNQREFKLYKKHFAIINAVAPSPDLLIYINTSKENLLQNIKKRGRSYETSIDKKYLKRVSEKYTEGIKKLKNIPVIEFDVKKYDSHTVKTMVDAAYELITKKQKFKYKKVKI